MNSTTQRITVLAAGTALFVALSVCLQVPVFENYNPEGDSTVPAAQKGGN